MIRERTNPKSIKRYYNSNLKEEFIKTYNAGDSKDYMWNSIFLRTLPVEEMKDKDCCNFIYSEIENLLRSFRSSSVGTLAVKLSILTSYTDFCIERGFSIDNQNHYREIDTTKMINYIDKRKAQYAFLTYTDVMDVVSKLESNRDKYLVLGIYCGLIGKEFEDFIDITNQDLLGDNKILIRSTGEIRTVPDNLYKIMEKAGNEYEVVFKNGKTWEFVGDNIFKRTKTKNAGKITKTAITKRIGKIRGLLDLPMFGMKALTSSGFCREFMIYCDSKNLSPEDAIKTDVGQSMKVNYDMPINDYICVKTYKKYVEFVRAFKPENNQ